VEENVSLIDGVMVHQAKAERLFAGAVWLDDDYARQSCGWLKPEMFLDQRLGEYWRLVLDGKQANDAAVATQAYFDVMDCVTQVATGRDAPAFAGAIAMDVYLRDASSSLGDMARAIVERDVLRVKQLAQGIVEGSPESGCKIPDSSDIGLEFIAALDNITGRSEKFGIANLDAATGGMECPSLTILASRPSMGKSSMGIQIARYKAEAEKKRVSLFALEMNRINVWARMVCGDAGVAWRDVRAGRATPAQLQALADASSALIDCVEDRLYIDDRPRLTIDEIWRAISNLKPDLAIIDHMGLVAPTDRDEVKSLGDISRMCKVMSKEFKIPILALYQLNRDNDKGNQNGNRRRPVMSDLRGSGKIEENADNVLFLYRPDYYDDAQAKAKTVSDSEIIVAKFREGVRNIQIHLEYHLDQQRFYPRARETEANAQTY
jgi:replicative DNA helicase